MVEHIHSSLPAKEASGVVAGAAHGFEEPIEGVKETAKRFLGVGKGREETNPNYVPANVTNGSWNPTKWNWSQLPQKVAETAPSMIPDVAAGAAGAKVGKTFGGAKGAAIGAILGSALSGTARTAGDTAKEATVARTGDANAESSTADLVRGGATAAAASAAGAVLPTRFVPGLSPATKDVVGASGALDAAKRYLATTALGGAGGAGSNVINQAGLTVGTDKGLTIDPSQIPEAAVAGAATGGTLGLPKLAGDAVRAGTLSKFGGDNLAPTKNVATRLEAASEKLGNAKSDEAALGTVMSDLKTELGDAANKVRQQLPGLSVEANNALVRAQRGEKITPAEIELIKSETAAAPDGANAAFLAHSIHAANLMSERGGHSNRGWAGGMSGVMDKNLGFLLNPARLAGGAAATALGMHLLGTSNPMFGGALAGTYLGTRAIDGMTGMRSPAKTFVEHFADSQAQLRIPPNNTPPGGGGGAPPQAPTPGPWGPKPLPTQSVPSVQPPAAPAAPAPALNPIAMKMLGQTLKQGLPPTPQAPDPMAAAKAMLQQRAYLEKVKANSAVPEPAAAPAPINPLMLPKDITGPAKTLTKGMADVETMRQTQQAKDAVASLPSPLMDETPIDVTRNPLIGKRAATLVGAANALKKYTATKEEPEAVTLNSGATADVTAPQTMADVLRNSELRATAAKKIKKSNGKVAVDAGEVKASGNPEGEVKATRAPFEPFEADDPRVLYEKGTTAREYGEGEAARKGTSNERYKKNAEKTAKDWIKTTSLLSGKFPGYKHSFEATLHHLLNIGSNTTTRREAIEHFASHVPDDVAQAMREHYK
jgi:hypothetical protein